MKYMIEEDGLYREAEGVEALEDNVIEVEERTVYLDSENNLSITVDGDGLRYRNFVKDPYFKFHKSSNKKKGDTIRISFSNGKPRYVVHGKDDKTLNSTERKELDKLMDSVTNVKEYKGLTVWEAIKKAVQDESENATQEDKDRINSLKRPSFRDIQPAK